jgi:hypothetical protein
LSRTAGAASPCAVALVGRRLCIDNQEVGVATAIEIAERFGNRPALHDTYTSRRERFLDESPIQRPRLAERGAVSNYRPSPSASTQDGTIGTLRTLLLAILVFGLIGTGTEAAIVLISSDAHRPCGCLGSCPREARP